ncbi:hypothetical protein SJDPG12_08795 [Porphyromonas gingivalis SJD12]|nr:hypothetical protein SJDPG12_08795 [Porphyromonas gingivalis SJD12]
MFQSELLRNALAFRGGTALHKLFIAPQVRYSEDIDLVQISSEPIKPILMEIRKRLAFLGTKRVVKQHIHNNTILYRFESEMPPIVNLRLKIEINTREHFSVLGLQDFPFRVENSWFSGETTINTYKLEELLGTKLRALYQRRKGRDLFDLYWSLKRGNVDLEQVLACYQKYMEFVVDKVPSKKQFLANMEDKMQDEEFLSDMRAIIRPGINYSPQEAWTLVKEKLVDLL